jgi:hypothetical protein
LDTIATIDIAPSQTFQPTQTYTLPAGDFYNWPDDAELWLRITPGQPGNLQTIPIWVHPGSNAAPPNNVSVSGLDATQLQGVPISTNIPSDKQGLLYNANTGEWTPTSLTTAQGDLIVGDGTGEPSILPIGPANYVLTSSGGISPIWFPAVNAVAAGAGISVSSSTGGVVITNTAASPAVPVVTQLPNDVAVSHTANTNVLAVGPIATGFFVDAKCVMTFTNTGTADSVSAELFAGPNTGGTTLFASGTVTLNNNFWGQVALTGGFNVSSTAVNFVWVVIKAQTGGGGNFLAKAANIEGFNGACTLNCLIIPNP